MRPWIAYGLLFAGAAALSALTVLHGLNPHDEGLMLQAAARIADGQLPYRDFWWNYGPGQPLLLGGLQELFGPSLLTWRVVRVLLDAGVACWPSRWPGARREPSRWRSLAWLAAAPAMAFPRLPNPVPAALALGLGAVLLARARAGGRRGAGGAGRRLPARPGAGRRAGRRAGRQRRRRAAVLALRRRGRRARPWSPSGRSWCWPGPGGSGTRRSASPSASRTCQRLPLPGACDGGLRPRPHPRLLLPYVLLAGWRCGWWRPCGGGRSAAELAALPLALAGVLYLLARADEFHRIPWRPCCRRCWRPPSRRELDGQPRAGRSRWPCRSR